RCDQRSRLLRPRQRVLWRSRRQGPMRRRSRWRFCPKPSLACLRIFNQQRDALPAPDTGRGDAVALARALEFISESERKPDARGAQRMSDGDGAAIDVELVFVEPELHDAGKDLRAERFID